MHHLRGGLEDVLKRLFDGGTRFIHNLDSSRRFEVVVQKSWGQIHAKPFPLGAVIAVTLHFRCLLYLGKWVITVMPALGL